MRVILTFVIAVALLIACNEKPKYQTDDYLMPSGSSDPTTIVKVVAVTGSTYKVFTHFLSDGRLIEAQDYVRIQPPRHRCQTQRSVDVRAEVKYVL